MSSEPLTDAQAFLLVCLSDMCQRAGRGLAFDEILAALVEQDGTTSRWYFYRAGGLLHSDEVEADMEVLHAAGWVRLTAGSLLVPASTMGD